MTLLSQVLILSGLLSAVWSVKKPPVTRAQIQNVIQRIGHIDPSIIRDAQKPFEIDPAVNTFLVENYANSPGIVTYLTARYAFWGDYLKHGALNDSHSSSFVEAIANTIIQGVVSKLGMRISSYNYLMHHRSDPVLLESILARWTSNDSFDNHSLNKAMTAAIKSHFHGLSPASKAATVMAAFGVNYTAQQANQSWDKIVDMISSDDAHEAAWIVKLKELHMLLAQHDDVIVQTLYAHVHLPISTMNELIEQLKLPENADARIILGDAISKLHMEFKNRDVSMYIMDVHVMRLVDNWSPDQNMNAYALRTIYSRDQMEAMLPDLYYVDVPKFARAYCLARKSYWDGGLVSKSMMGDEPSCADFFLAIAETRSTFLKIFLKSREMPRLRVPDDVLTYNALSQLVASEKGENSSSSKKTKQRIGKRLKFAEMSHRRSFYDHLVEDELEEIPEPLDESTETKTEDAPKTGGYKKKKKKPEEAPPAPLAETITELATERSPLGETSTEHPKQTLKRSKVDPDDKRVKRRKKRTSDKKSISDKDNLKAKEISKQKTKLPRQRKTWSKWIAIGPSIGLGIIIVSIGSYFIFKKYRHDLNARILPTTTN